MHASYHTLLDWAGVFCYAGTSADRAQETLDVTIQELKRLRDGIEEDELSRAHPAQRHEVAERERERERGRRRRPDRDPRRYGDADMHGASLAHAYGLLRLKKTG